MATETQRFMYQSQRSGGRPVVAPDIQAQNRVANAVQRADQKDKANIAAGGAVNVNLSRPLDIGTDAVYSTLPNNATRANLSAFFDVGWP